MTTAAPSTALATIQPAFTDAERIDLAGFLAGYRGLTVEEELLDRSPAAHVRRPRVDYEACGTAVAADSSRAANC